MDLLAPLDPGRDARHAFLSVTAMTIAAGHDNPDLVPVTRNELRHLLTTTLYAALTSSFRITRSLWRR